MHADDALGALGSRGDRRDQQRRGVGGQYARVADDAARQPREQLVLDLQALGRRLDHQLARGEIRRARAPLAAGREPPLACESLSRPRSTPRSSWARIRSRPRVKRLGDRVVQQRAGAGQARQLGDPGAHRARAGDSDRLGRVDCDAHAGTSALIPVSARPMISFWICEVPSYSVVTRDVAQVALDRIVVDVAGAAVNLDRGVRALDRGLGGVELRDRGLSRVRLAGVLQVAGAPHQHPRGVGLDRHVRDHLLDELEARDRASELLSLLRITTEASTQPWQMPTHPAATL